MGVLPPERVMTTAPFASTGVDIMGPFLCKLNGRASHKIYVAVFTCFETRSVHAECVFKLDADSALNAIVRFCARRPGLTKLFSDRGTNFQGAEAKILSNFVIGGFMGRPIRAWALFAVSSSRFVQVHSLFASTLFSGSCSVQIHALF